MKKYLITCFSVLLGITLMLFLNVSASAETYANYWDSFIAEDRTFELTIYNVDLEDEVVIELPYGSYFISGNKMDFTTYVRDEIDVAIVDTWGINSNSYVIDFWTGIPTNRRRLSDAGFETRFFKDNFTPDNDRTPYIEFRSPNASSLLVDARIDTATTFINSKTYPILEQQDIASITITNFLYIDKSGYEQGITSLEYKIVGGGDPYYTNIINELNNRIAELEKQISKASADKIQLENNLRVLRQQYENLLEDYEEALNGEISLSKLILTYIDIPIKTISGFLGFELFGTNLFQALTGILTMLVIIWIIKKIL